jgi:hypothetical protein
VTDPVNTGDQLPAWGIRIRQLRLSGATGASRSYGARFDTDDGGVRPLSVIAGPSQTGKTSIADFIRYCLGDDEHPQHPEVIAYVRAALLETVLAERVTTIERAATGPASTFASVWQAPISELADATELRMPTEPSSAPDGLSQFVLTACGLDNVELPEAPSKQESATQTLSVRDLFHVMWLPNHRLDGKNLVFENSHFMVTQKFRQTIDVMFDVHDAAGADLAARIKSATDAAREAAHSAQSLQAIVAEEHPLGPLVLETDQQTVQREVRALTTELQTLDAQVNAQQGHVTGLRQALTQTQERLSAATVRRRNRESLLERLASLRGQYADDKRKLAFLRQAEQLFDPLHVTVCPACLSRLSASPAIVDGHCGMCGHTVTGTDGAPLSLGAATAPDRSTDDQTSLDEDPSTNGASPVLGTEHGRIAGAAQRPPGGHPSNSSAEGQDRAPTVVLEAELRAVTKRLDELTEYWTRLDDDLRRLRADESAAAQQAEEAAVAMNRAATLPAPYLAARDAVAGRLTEARLRLQTIESGLRLWARVRAAEENAARLAGHASQLRAERRAAAARPDRAAIVRKLSNRFGQVLADIGYPKLSEPYLNNDLMPSVRGLPYTAASSGGLTLISLAWYVSLWEVAFEEGARAPGLLIIDSPQKNLGQRAEDPDFADARLVENFYRHVKTWLAGPGDGAQLIVIDNSPPDLVAGDVVVRYTRSARVAPYGLVEDALD